MNWTALLKEISHPTCYLILCCIRRTSARPYHVAAHWMGGCERRQYARQYDLHKHYSALALFSALQLPSVSARWAWFNGDNSRFTGVPVVSLLSFFLSFLFFFLTSFSCMLSVPHPGCKCCYQIRSGIPRPSILLTDCMKEREGHKLFARYRGSFAGPPTIPLFVLLVLKRGMWRERPGLFCGKCCPFTSKKKYYSLSSTKLTREVLRRVTEAEERMGT